MSRGTRITPIRIPADLLARVDEAIASANLVRTEEEYDRSSWIRHAIEEKLSKLERGRRGKRRGGPAAEDLAGGAG